MSKFVLVAPDNRYLTHITPNGGASLAVRFELARRMSETTANKLIRYYRLAGFTPYLVEL